METPDLSNPTPTSAASGGKKQLLGYLLSIALLALLVYLTDYREILQALGEMTVGSVLYLMLISVLLIYISALKWQLFLAAFGSFIPALRLFRLYLVGYFVNLILPSFVGGDAVRSWYVGRTSGQHHAFTSTILERYTGFLAMVALAVVFVWFAEQATFEIKVLVLCVALGLAVGTFLALSTKALALFAKLPRTQPIIHHLHKVQAGLQLAARNKPLLVKALLLSVLYHSVTVVNTIAAGYVVGWDNAPVQELFVVLPLILIIGALPITPSGLGIQEGAFLYFLSTLGASPAQALGVALVLRAKSYVLAALGWICWLLEKNRPS
jgi:glycosyltransferase 2 family protein